MRYQNKKNWYYRIYEDCHIKLKHRFPRVDHDFFIIDGHDMWIKKGYTFDGPTGIPKKLHTKKMIFISLPHDAFYQAMREQLLEIVWKKKADDEIEYMYRERSSKWFSWFGSWIHTAVDWLGKPNVKNDIMEAN